MRYDYFLLATTLATTWLPLCVLRGRDVFIDDVAGYILAEELNRVGHLR